MATSTIPAAIDGLLALLAARPALAGVPLYDGPPLSETSTPHRIVVGYDGTDQSVDGDQEWASSPYQAPTSRDERYVIRCLAEAWTGSTTLKSARDDAFTLLAEIEQAVRGDPTLGGAVLYAGLGGGITVQQPQTDAGALCSVTFGVVCRARI